MNDKFNHIHNPTQYLIETRFDKQYKVNEYIVDIVNRLLQLLDQLLVKTNRIMLYVMRLENEKQ
jgi:hypothetical protein